MQLFFTIVYIRITTLTLIFHDHPLVEYPLWNLIFSMTFQKSYFCLLGSGEGLLKGLPILVPSVNESR